MEQRTAKWKAPGSVAAVEKVLESRYAQLVKWGELLTRADAGAAREIVHDLCVYLFLNKPDFSGILNLDGYLYTCLQHIYRGRIARSSREALRFISVGDFDSIQFALAGSASGNSVDTQNELRRICCYSVWRKESSKSFSYFILHFFHGYFAREIAEIGCLPVAAIYNKLKSSRTELRSYLAEPDKLRFTHRDSAPQPAPLWTPLSSVQIFRELRETILRARMMECLPEEELLDRYRTPSPSPLPCALLAHVVSCERCLALIDNHFRRPTLKDRDALDGIDPIPSKTGAVDGETGEPNAQTMLASVRRRWTRIYEHRPGALSIAVNGRIIAFHDVQAEHSVLSARIDRPESVEFVEVFSEQDLRLGLVPIDAAPPEGPHTATQSVTLSDDRWLKLSVTFDGLGLQSEVAYFDPALKAISLLEETEETPELSVIKGGTENLPTRAFHGFRAALSTLLARVFGVARQAPALSWAITIVCVLLFGGGYLLYRSTRASLSAVALLNRSADLEAASQKGYAEHQILRLEGTALSGRTLKGRVDVWKDNENGRYMRRLYDEQQHLIAAEWRGRDGKSGSYVAGSNAGVSDEDRQLAASGLWKQDVSSQAFRALAGDSVQVTVTNGDYELMSAEAGNRGHVVSAMLVLDRDLHPIRETLRFRGDSGVQELGLVQTDWTRQPSSAVPDSVFTPGNIDTSASRVSPTSSIPRENLRPAASEIRLVQLHIAVLHQLNELRADIAEPIEVTRTSDGYIRVSGTVSDRARKTQIISALESLPDHQFLRIGLTSQGDVRIPAPDATQSIAPPSNIYSVPQNAAPATTVLRAYFVKNGWSGDRAESAARQFSEDVLRHAQRALQHAYALDRLGSAFTSEELLLAGPAFQRQWAEMAAGHASALESELRALHEQMALITVGTGELNPLRGDDLSIDAPAEFAQAASRLLQKTQSLNRSISRIFAAGTSDKLTEGPNILVANAANAIPLREAAEMVAFAVHLAGGQTTTDRRSGSLDKQLHDRPQ